MVLTDLLLDLKMHIWSIKWIRICRKITLIYRLFIIDLQLICNQVII